MTEIISNNILNDNQSYLDNNKIYHGDCFEEMKKIKPLSVDTVICDLPYGITDLHWDKIINIKKMWDIYQVCCKRNANIILFSKQPFTTYLIYNLKCYFKYSLIWNRDCISDFMSANKKPLNIHEDILIFKCYSSVKRQTYNPQKTKGKRIVKKRSNKIKEYQLFSHSYQENLYDSDERYPKSILNFKRESKKLLLNTQKPAKLIEWLIKSYSNENDIILDNCIGSGTTAIAAMNTDRKFIGIEKNKDHFDIACNRINLYEKNNNKFMQNIK